MAFSFLRRGTGSDDRLDHIEDTIQQMLADDGHAFDLAMASLLGDIPVDEIRKEVKRTDKRVNEGERTIRRELVVHASVAGTFDSPALLVYMSIVKDIERIGDYAKNLLDLARDGVTLGQHDHWRAHTSEVAAMIRATASAFESRDVEASNALLAQGDRMLDAYDDEVSVHVRAQPPEPDAVAQALALRYLKRIVAHLTNVLSSVVMPLDQLDYFDEDPEDRADRATE
jgi:phosphate transport system protein